MTDHKLYVKLTISHPNLAPKSIEDRLGVRASELLAEGETYRLGSKAQITKTSDSNYWTLVSGLDTNRDINEHIQALISEIGTNFRQIKDISEDSGVYIELSVAYYYQGTNPGLHLTRPQLKWLSDIGAELDLDVYCLPELSEG